MLNATRIPFTLLALILVWPTLAAPPLKLANTNSLLTSLISLADDQDLYDQFGLRLELTPEETETAALRSLLAGQTDLAVVAGAPFVKHALKHPNLRLIACIGQTDNTIKIATHREREIRVPGQLRGKRIGTQPGGTAQLFLQRLLQQQGLTERDITPVFMPEKRLPSALAKGLVDAITIRESQLSLARAQLPLDLHLIDAPGVYLESVNLVTTAEFLDSAQAESLIPLLQALHEAERRLSSQPTEMTALLSKQLAQNPDRVEHRPNEARLSMDGRLLTSLQTIAQWLTPGRDGLRDSLELLPYLHTPLLAKVKPQGVNLSP